jgi:hypothetical protein
LEAIDFNPKDVSVVPGFLASDLLQYDAYFDHEIGHFVERNTRQPITFDFNKDYVERVLVHHASGRLRGASVAALSRLRLHNDLCDELAKRLNSIGSNYVSVHVRNTDYKTNYQTLLNQLGHHPAFHDCENLFVASDDIACLEACKNKFPNVNIISFSKLPQDSVRPIHRLAELDDAYQRNKDAILDLLMLALSHKFIFLELKENRWGAKYSGFSMLALDLRNCKTVLRELISRPELNIRTEPV